MGRKRFEMIGLKFGKLTVTAYAKNRNQGGGVPLCVCSCECGNVVEVAGARLRAGNTKSCGCFRRDRAGGLLKSHGKSKTMPYCMFYDARKRAFALNLPFDLSPDDIVIPDKCPVLGIHLKLKGLRDARPSLDRIIPKDGYTKKNTRVISFRANRIKSDATFSELKAIALYIEGELNALP